MWYVSVYVLQYNRRSQCKASCVQDIRGWAPGEDLAAKAQERILQRIPDVILQELAIVSVLTKFRKDSVQANIGRF